MNFPLEAYLSDLATLCAIDSGDANREGTNAMADYFEARYRAMGLHVERRYYENNDFAPFLLAENGAADTPIDVLLVAHMDTVFPVGEGASRPFKVDPQGIGRGPGCVDCKGGCLMIEYLVRQWMQEGVSFHFCVAMNSDEERGSQYSRAYFEELAQRAKRCFIFEPGRANGEFVTQRKGGANYLIRCHGVAAHSGVNPQDGASAIIELARWLPELQSLNDYKTGTTLNIGRIDGGGDRGQVPDYCECTVSFRTLDPKALSMLETQFRQMTEHPFDPRTQIEIQQVSQRPAMILHPASAALLSALERVGEREEIPICHLSTGGGSDGNFISHYGVATLDGCGPCGAALHTKDEYMISSSIEQRFRLMNRLIHEITE